MVDERCLNAIQRTDPFHVVRWASDALDQVRRQVWNAARKGGQPGLAHALKGARWTLWHNPENLTQRQQATLVEIERTNQPLFRAYLLKEELRYVFQLSARRGLPRLDRWTQWARRSRPAPFVKSARTIAEYRASIAAALRYGLSNTRIESGNQKIRLIIRRSFGFHHPAALTALAKLSLRWTLPCTSRPCMTHGNSTSARKCRSVPGPGSFTVARGRSKSSPGHRLHRPPGVCARSRLTACFRQFRLAAGQGPIQEERKCQMTSSCSSIPFAGRRASTSIGVPSLRTTGPI